ncbi:hypothetical protein H4G63_004513 [Salmonella enterica]|uniref:hypothetical protein n=1 Tax=Gammaproteobacteria TaxID=1236 RepID=UPI0009AC54E7|nr:MULTISPECIES: hypothetical protein [Gammaproteobacteria]HEB4994558.1 hypothetical protein [Aeromonas hydrophila subsp. hydrophila]EFY7055470.1 hypothetical protein [Salmonella enterica]EGE9999193.1 hypothetical protein [Salmonella enterica]EHU3740636.1 hypothetical protein [Salmonella enterica]EHW9253326.1 hypothetical protein [Salmonella enterica]
MSKTGNPLIRENKGDTIEQIHAYVEWLCLSVDGDDQSHPGMGLSLHVVREAINSLREEKQGLSNDTQKV